MAKLGVALAQSSDRESWFDELRAGLAGSIPYDALAVYRRQGESLFPEFTDGQAFLDFLSVQIPVGQGLSGWVAENGRAIVNGNPAVEPGYVRDPSKYVALASALAVPLIHERGIVGVLSLYRRKSDAFSKDELAALNSIAPTLAGLLELPVRAA
jgi:GAF domain-containing protein